jgi:hypothetical protein
MGLPNLGGLSLRAETKAHPCLDDALCASDPSDSEEEPPKEEYTDRDMPDVPSEASDEEVLGDSYMEALDNHRRRKLELASSKIGVDEVMLVLDAISRSDASKGDICEQVMDWCSVNKTNHNGCKEAGSDFWYTAITRVFPFEIFAPFTKLSSSPASWSLWTTPELWGDRAIRHYKVDITSFFNACYGYSLAGSVAKGVLVLLLNGAKLYYQRLERLAQRGLSSVNDDTGVSVTSYSILNVLEDEADKAWLVYTESNARDAHNTLQSHSPLFKRIERVFFRNTAKMLFRLTDDHLMIRPSKEDPPGIDTTNETYPLVRLRAVAGLMGIHIVRMWKCMSLFHRYPLLKGWSSIRTLYHTLHTEYRAKFFRTLFPSLITHRNEGIYSLPPDRQGDHLDSAMYKKFSRRENTIVYLVRGPNDVIYGIEDDVDTGNPSATND